MSEATLSTTRRRKIGRVLRRLREESGYTLKTAGAHLERSPSSLSQIENGDLDVNEVATLSRYANALGARLRIIFDYGDDLRQIA